MGTVMLSSPVEVAAEVGEIEFLPLRITFEAKDDGRLPPFLGSALRGALGWSLRRVSCALRRESCPSCIVRERCAYGYIIETARPDGSERLPGHRDVPHPYMLEPPVPGAGEWRAGDNLSFGLVLFGRSAEYVGYLVVALRDLAQRGLGRNRLPFELTAMDVVVPHRRATAVYRPGAPLAAVRPARLIDAVAGRPARDRAVLELLTPTRLTDRGSLTRRPAFHVLVRALLLRALAMRSLHGSADVDFDVRGLTELAKSAETGADDLALLRMERYSTRQDARVPLDGMLGRIEYCGEAVRDLWPLLEAGELLGVGKGTVFGLGRYRMREGEVTARANGGAGACGRVNAR